MLRIVSWQSMLSDHQVHFLRALARLPDVELHVVAARRMHRDRGAQGWTAASWEGIPHTILRPDTWRRQATTILQDYGDAFHVFGGIWSDRRFPSLLFFAARRKMRVGLVMEPYSDVPYGYLSETPALKGWLSSRLRPAAYRLAGRLLGGRIQALFAISPKAETQYRRAGFPVECIFPFGYFVPRAAVFPASDPGRRGGDRLRAAYIGSLIARKGPDIAVAACRIALARGAPLQLDLYGPGEAAKYVPRAESGVRYCGPIPFGNAQAVIASYDLVIVPSRFDGWGVVVNEALLQGVPVLASGCTGASVLVEASGGGRVFDAGDTNGLAGILTETASNRDNLSIWKDKAKSFVSRLDPALAADYFRCCLCHRLFQGPRPTPHWTNA